MRKKQRDIEKEKKRAEMAMNEDSMTEQRVHVKEVATGKILRGEDAPLASELEAWLEKNPGYEEVPRDEDSEDESDDEAKGEGGSAEDAIAKAKKEGDAGDAENVDYYSIAHTVSESISEQASILGKSNF